MSQYDTSCAFDQSFDSNSDERISDIDNNETHDSILDNLTHSTINEPQDNNDTTDYLSAHFVEVYNACPIFYDGSWEEAWIAAFYPQDEDEIRPLLFYFHDRNSIFTNSICNHTLCSELLIEYLLENYIVWACDIASEHAKNQFMKQWSHVFESTFIDGIFNRTCSTLVSFIPVIDQSTEAQSYEPVVLMQEDKIISNGTFVDQDTLLRELMQNKEKFYYHLNGQQ